MSNTNNKEIEKQLQFEFWRGVSCILWEYIPASDQLKKEHFDTLQEEINELEQINGQLKSKHYSIIKQLRDLSVIKLNAWPNILDGVFVAEEVQKLFDIADKQLKKYF